MKEQNELDLALLARVNDTYRAALVDSPKAREWLIAQGIRDCALLERFSLGFAPGTIKKILPQEPKVRRALRGLGILTGPGRGREHLAGCVILPLFDPAGRVVELVGFPTAGGSVRTAGMRGALFNWPAMKSHSEVRLLSDALRALSEVAGGEEAVIALPDGEWTEITEKTFQELAPHRVLIDEPRLRKEVAPHLLRLGIGRNAAPKGSESPAEIENGFAAQFGKRRYVVQAVSRENPRHLRALLRAVGRTPGRFHLDALDLYSSRERTTFVREASLLFGEDSTLIEADLGRVISMAEEHLARTPGSDTVEVGEEARREAMEMLRDPNLLDRILKDFEGVGLVGEKLSKLAGYLVAISRKMEDPLSLLILSRSAAGKSTLAYAVASLVPSEDVIRLTRMTGQALFYQKNKTLRHKLLVVEEESGVTQAAYPLRVLQSAKELAVATPGGFHVIEGPVAVIVTTTSSDLNDETKSRFLVVSVDESRGQTRAIQESQRKREAGARTPREEIRKRHHALQRCLRPMKVVNPYAEALRFPDDRLASRREHPKYLALIRVVTFLRQYQRKEVDGAIRVELEDIEVAHRLADELLGQSLEDLSPPARKLLEEIHRWKRRGLFTRRELRAHLAWGTTQLWMYLKELADHEWLIDRGGKPKTYELAWDGREGRVMLGLSSIGEIRARFGRDSGRFGKVRKR